MQVTSCAVMCDGEGKSKGFGFIAFEEPEMAEKVGFFVAVFLGFLPVCICLSVLRLGVVFVRLSICCRCVQQGLFDYAQAAAAFGWGGRRRIVGAGGFILGC